MNDHERDGRLGFFHRLALYFFPAAVRGDRLPYRRRDDFLTEAELRFYRVLVSAAGDRAIICPKVNLADIVFVVDPRLDSSWRNSINKKHVDFLLCDPITMHPQCAIELDDSSHLRRDRQVRDDFVNDVFQSARLPLIRIRVTSAYRVEDLRTIIEDHFGYHLLRDRAATREAPLCPKCSMLMVRRVAQYGANEGLFQYECPNAPVCTETRNLNSQSQW